MEKHDLIMMMGGFLGLAALIIGFPGICAEEDSKKDLCKDNGGNWEDGSCDFETDDEDKADSYTNDLQKIRDFEEERAAEEDALCDDPDANFDICNTDGDDDDRLLQGATKRECEGNDGDWDGDECDFTGVR